MASGTVSFYQISKQPKKRDAGWLLEEKANNMEDALDMSLKQDDCERDIGCEQVKKKSLNRGKIPLARIERHSLRDDQKGDYKILTLGGFVFKLKKRKGARTQLLCEHLMKPVQASHQNCPSFKECKLLRVETKGIQEVLTNLAGKLERESSKEIALKHPRAIHWKPLKAASIEKGAKTMDSLPALT